MHEKARILRHLITHTFILLLKYKRIFPFPTTARWEVKEVDLKQLYNYFKGIFQLYNYRMKFRLTNFPQWGNTFMRNVISKMHLSSPIQLYSVTVINILS